MRLALFGVSRRKVLSRITPERSEWGNEPTAKRRKVLSRITPERSEWGNEPTAKRRKVLSRITLERSERTKQVGGMSMTRKLEFSLSN